MCVFWSFTATPLVTICPRVSQDRDVCSKLHREEVVLELQRPAVEMSGWQRWQSRMLPEVSERVWGELPSSVGKLPRATIHTSSNTNKQKRWRRKNIGFHWPWYSTFDHCFCLSIQVKYFTKRRDFLKYKEKMETEGFTPAEGPKQPS